MVISELVRECAGKLSENPRFEAELIVMNALGIDRTRLITDGRRSVTEDRLKSVREMLERRINGEPLQYILGETEFMSLPFKTGRGALIPRSDTETLVETVIGRIEWKKKILDICCGSGCIGISAAHYRPEIFADMLDISGEALRLSAQNALLNGVDKRVNIFEMDILKEYPKEKYDAVVSNPPYIETDVVDTLDSVVKDYEPRIALDGGEDGLKFYRRLADILPHILKPGGFAAFEIGFNQGKSVSELMEKYLNNVKIIKDLCGNDRVAAGIMKG